MVRKGLAVMLAVVCVGVEAACGGNDGPSPREVAQEFLAAWSSGDLGAAAGLTDASGEAQPVLEEFYTELSPSSADLVARDVSEDGDSATVTFTAEWTLSGLREPWRYESTLPLAKDGETWLITWRPDLVHPELSAGEKFLVQRALPERAPIRDATGQPLFSTTDVVIVGIQPRSVTDLNGVAATIASEVNKLPSNPGLDPAEIAADVRETNPDHFVPVITLRRSDYDMVRHVIHPLTGVVFREERRSLPVTPNFAQPFLGRVSEASNEILDEAGPQYSAGDQLGVSGLQRALNKRLSGEPGITISVAPGAKDSSGETTVINETEGVPGTAVTLTLDRRIQNAADQAAASVPNKTAIVALRPSSGEILAVSNSPNAGFDMAMTGQVPAGSTFKIVSTAAALDAGIVSPTASVDCPARIEVDGRRFENQDAFQLGQVPLRRAFAQSCNTTVIGLSQQLDGAALQTMAGRFGIGANWQLPVPSFSGSLDQPETDVDLAAAAIGQGKVLVSPLAMALVAATVQKGSAPAPSIVKGEVARAENAPQPPPASVINALRDFTRAVVSEGTASALSDLPGEEIAGKTGTAEYGSEVPPRSHAWFVGSRGDLAFAVFVEDGQSSRTTAIPVARKFLEALN